MTGWLPDGATEWGGRPVARLVADAAPRCRAVLSGTVRVVVVHRPAVGTGRVGRATGWSSFDGWLDDGTGTMVLRWLGRESVPGVVAGALLTAEGTVADVHGRLLILNPLYRFDPGGPGATPASRDPAVQVCAGVPPSSNR